MCFEDADRETLARMITRLSDGSTKKCLDSPAIDCPRGLTMNQILHPNKGKDKQGGKWPKKQRSNSDNGNQSSSRRGKDRWFKRRSDRGGRSNRQGGYRPQHSNASAAPSKSRKSEFKT